MDLRQFFKNPYINHSRHHGIPGTENVVLEISVFDELINNSTRIIEAQCVQHDRDKMELEEFGVILVSVNHQVAVVHY